MKNIAIYPGTFDPITYGHIDVIKKGINIFDHLVVAVSEVGEKNHLFSIEDRIKLVKSSLYKDMKISSKKIQVIKFSSLTTTLCKKFNSNIILRGLRAVSDFEYEFQLAGMNRKLNEKIETIFLMSDVDNQVISSRLVKEIATLNGSLTKFITKSVIKEIKKKNMKFLTKTILFFILFNFTNINAKENIMILKLKTGNVKIELFPDVAPNHVSRIKELANSGKYDNVVFHRVIDGFMAQTGDVQYGNSADSKFNLQRAGMGGSELPDLKAEFNNTPHVRGTLSMARSSDPNSANSQFFICFEAAPHLDRQYTVFGKVIEGMDNIDKITKGDGPNGSVSNPDKIISFRSE